MGVWADLPSDETRADFDSATRLIGTGLKHYQKCAAVGEALLPPAAPDAEEGGPLTTRPRTVLLVDDALRRFQPDGDASESLADLGHLECHGLFFTDPLRLTNCNVRSPDV